jgi:hypothetical protein
MRWLIESAHEYQAEFRDLKNALSAGGVDAETPFMALDSMDAVSGYTGEIIVSFALIAGSVVTGVVGAWLQKKAGRKIIIKIGDNRLEASTKEDLTVEQLNKLLHLMGATKKMENNEEWITAAEAVRLLQPVFDSEITAKMTICKRAHNGMIRARARRFIMDSKSADNVEIQKIFWWAEGHSALTQNWTAGDFDTWVDSHRLTGNLNYSALKVHFEALGVSFLRADIESLIPAGTPAPQPPSTPTVAPSGRPPADWWEDCLIDLCFKHFRAELPHKTQADIVRAMQDWILAHGYDAAESTIKLRARKLLEAIRQDEKAEK